MASKTMVQDEDFLKDYCRVDLHQLTESFIAVKKYLGESGPFEIDNRRAFSISETFFNNTDSPHMTNRVHEAELVLGYGLNSITYKNHQIWIWYRAQGEPLVAHNQIERFEKLTIYMKPMHNDQPDHMENSVAIKSDKPKDVVFKSSWQVLKAFINDALEFNHVQSSANTKVFTVNDRVLTWQMVTERPKRPIESVFINKELKKDLLDDITTFFHNKDFYAFHGIPFKRGYMLYGPPGCGKSSLVAAVAGHFGFSVCLLQIGHKKVTDNVLASLFMQAPPRSIILVEDIDTIFVERNRANEDQSVTFSGFINALDGVGSAEGKIVFITTNFEEKLDRALLRPGRIDKQYKIDYSGKEELEHMFLSYFPGKEKKAKMFRDSVAGNSVSTAEVQQHFIKYQNDADECTKQRFELVDNSYVVKKKMEAEKETYSYMSLW